jgi:hypothetical protein
MKPLLAGSMILLSLVVQSADTGAASPEMPPIAKVQQPAPQRLALLIGISKYQQVTTNAWRQLHAHRDVTEMKRVLMKPQYGFQEEDIRVLEDRLATADRIRHAVKDFLIAKSKPGAVVILYFSGHGQQVLDQNGDELDGLDESIVPYDATDQRASEGAKFNIRDDEIAIWLRQLEAKLRGPSGKVDGSINVFLDSCFSGTATRGTLVERGRGWEEALDGPKPKVRAVSAVAGMKDRGLLDIDGDYLFLSALQSNQTAKEVGDMGLFTRALVGALERATDRTTYRELLGEVTVEVMSQVRNQIPQFEGNQDLRLFSGHVEPAQPYVPVIRAQPDQLTLPVGTLQLVSVGSIYSIYPAGSGPLSAGTKVGEAEVISISDTESQLRCTFHDCEKLPASAPASQRPRC